MFSLMAITVICPILNEMRFLPAWLACVRKFADEIIVCDTGSSDGSYEFLKAQGVTVYRHSEKLGYLAWNRGKEGGVRNCMLAHAKTDWIVPLDSDELVGEDFIDLVKNLTNERFLIGRFVHYMFWESLNTLRARSLKPLLFFQGKFYPMRNFRGRYPCKIPRLFRNTPSIRYSTTNNHCLLQYKNYGHLSYHLPQITKSFNIGFYHYHYCLGKGGKANMDWELGHKVKTVPFVGQHPKEAKLIIYDSNVVF